MSLPLVIVVDGLISCGKTTYINMLATHLTKRGWKITIVKEPIDKWMEKGPGGSPSIFELFNNDKARWSYHFQTKAFHDRVIENQKMFEKYGNVSQIFILERFCSTDRLFMETLYEGGYVTPLEMQHYKEWADLWQKVVPYEPDLFIYLNPPVDVCMDRIPKRNRPGEEGVTREYQEILKRHHDEFFAGDSVSISGDSHFVPCIKISTVENYRDDVQVQEKLTSHFEDLVSSIIKTRGVLGN
jgi:deoxyadenosine/deoxycytidine kinase